MVLRISKQIRREALPFAYRRTKFDLCDQDGTIKFLIAIGQVGRDNIESIRLAWESDSELRSRWDDDVGDLLPALHTSTCIQLLRQCKRLRHLSLKFSKDLILNMAREKFMADLGIQGLCSLQGVRRLEIKDLGMDSLEGCNLARWLKEQVEGRREKGKT